MNYYPDYFQLKSLTDLTELPPKKIYFLAGGTDLLCYLRDGLIDKESSCFADISQVEELKGISESADYIRIGAGVTFTEICENELVQEFAPVLVSAAKTIGTPQIRNRATIGGNIANASPAGDSLPALAVQNAELELNNRGTWRAANILEIFSGPKKTALTNGEVIAAIRIPKKENWQGGFRKIGGRRSHIISKVSVAVYLLLKGKIIADIKIALGAVAPTVVLAEKSAEVLRQKTISQENIHLAINAFKEIVNPIDDFRSTAQYRREVIGPLFQQLITEITS